MLLVSMFCVCSCYIYICLISFVTSICFTNIHRCTSFSFSVLHPTVPHLLCARVRACVHVSATHLNCLLPHFPECAAHHYSFSTPAMNALLLFGAVTIWWPVWLLRYVGVLGRWERWRTKGAIVLIFYWCHSFRVNIMASLTFMFYHHYWWTRRLSWCELFISHIFLLFCGDLDQDLTIFWCICVIFIKYTSTSVTVSSKGIWCI